VYLKTQFQKKKKKQNLPFGDRFKFIINSIESLIHTTHLSKLGQWILIVDRERWFGAWVVMFFCQTGFEHVVVDMNVVILELIFWTILYNESFIYRFSKEANGSFKIISGDVMLRDSGDPH